MSGLAQAAAANRAALIEQLYTQWHGYYLLMVLRDGRYEPFAPLSRDEAAAYRCRADESLRVIWQQEK